MCQGERQKQHKWATMSCAFLKRAGFSSSAFRAESVDWFTSASEKIRTYWHFSRVCCCLSASFLLQLAELRSLDILSCLLLVYLVLTCGLVCGLLLGLVILDGLSSGFPSVRFLSPFHTFVAQSHRLFDPVAFDMDDGGADVTEVQRSPEPLNTSKASRRLPYLLCLR